ncbi:hypothetical protein B0H14DRAFT_2574856 [Mycena olivaceomarginata]|nr:hypothetical protein B0H14DRAFT_2574856 [Mycena olivaceomarginata]
MASVAAQALQKVSLVGQHKSAVIVGGTLGIGAAIALIFGRDEARGAAVLEDLRRLSPEAVTVQLEFVKGELSMCAAAEALQKAGGEAGIDYLVMCQKGLPTGTINENADGYDTAFAVQAISRFALAYLLTKRRALASGASVMSIAAQGETLDDLFVDDLSLARRLATGISQTTMFLDQSKRDSCVLDAFHEELNIRYPKYQYFHLSPGLVSTEQFDVNKFPGLMKYAVWFGQRLIGTTPDKYAILPVYILTDGTVDHRQWAADRGNREALWAKLVGILGENQE